MKLLFQTGDVLEIPNIRSYKGWIYRPDEARTQAEIRRDLNKTFGRQWKDAAPAAQRWMRQWLQTQLDKLDWPKLLAVGDGKNPTVRLHGGGMQAAYRHPHLGWQQLSLRLKRDNKTGKVNAHYAWEGVNIQEWYWTRTVPDNVSYSNPINTTTLWERDVEGLTPEEGYESAGRFASRPISVVNMLSHLPFPLPESIQTPIDWPSKPTGWDGHNVSTDLIVAIDQDHVFWHNRKHAQKVLIESRQHFDQLAAALEHHGIDVTFTTSTDYDATSPSFRKLILSAVVFTIPPTADDENKLGHSFTFTERGMRIGCGYVEDEQRWEETQKRNAARWLEEMHADNDDYSATHEDYEYTPNV